MTQYYYEKYTIENYWNEESSDALDSKVMKSDTAQEIDVSGDTRTVTAGWPGYEYMDDYTAVVESSTGGYDSHVLEPSGEEKSAVDVHIDDVFYREEEYDNVLGREGFWKWKVYFKYYEDSMHYEIRLQVVGEIILEEYTIYKHRKKGSYVSTIVADDGEYPEDGPSGSYWYVKGEKPTVELSNISNKTVDEGDTLDFQIIAHIDGTSPITYNASNLPSGAEFEGNQFSWETNYSDEGVYEVTFEAEANGSTDRQTIQITVNHVDVEPQIRSIDNRTVDENENVSFSVQVINPDGVGTTLTASGLLDGAIFDNSSGEFDWTPSYFQSGTYNITFELDYGAGTDSESVTITVNEVHRPPVNLSPESNYETSDRRPYFVFELPPNDEADSYKYHTRLRISVTTDMSSLVAELNSRDNQENWELWDGSQWVEFPEDGVDPDSKVRARPEDILDYGFLYWDCCSWEESYGCGKNSAYRKINILISTEMPYILDIEGTEYLAYSINASETSNGEIGSVSFQVDNSDGMAYQNINYLDTVLLFINDDLGNQEQFRAIIKSKKPSGDTLDISAITGDGILSERRVKENYPAQDIGLTAKQIIDDYCSPLTSANINTDTGIIAPITADNEKPLQVFENIRKNYGLYYFVDANWDVNLYTQSEIQSAKMMIQRGSD